MADQISVFLEILRREGLIIVAILALGWQVYWLTTHAAETDTKWRVELAEWRGLITDLEGAAIARSEERMRLAQEVSDQMEDVKRIVIDLKEECLRGQKKEDK